MKILIVVPHSDFAPTLPLGPLSIASYLNAHGHEAVICDCMPDPDAIKPYLHDSAKPGLLALSLMASSALRQARTVAAAFREMGVPSVWGGGFTAAFSDTILESGCADYVSLGDGELSILQLADALEGKRELSAVSGLIYRDNGRIVANEAACLPAEELPRLDLTLVDPAKYAHPMFCTKKMVHLYRSKGCPFNCTFCARKLSGDVRYRARSMEDVIAEIRYLVTECGCDGIYFYDELWCLNQEAAFQFCDRIQQENLPFYFGCYARVGQYDRKGFEKLYAAGCRWMVFGIETGSAQLRAKLNKHLDEQAIYETFEICHELGIVTQAAFIVGLPGETEADLKKTVDMAFGIRADLLPFSNFTPIRGSVLYDELVQSGRLREEHDIDALEKKLFPVERVRPNYSEVPTKDLHVVRAFFRWCGFSNSGNNLSRLEIPKEMAKRYLTVMFPKGKISFSGIADSMTVLFDVLFNVFLHPGIRRKYGLYKKNFANKKAAHRAENKEKP